MVERKWYFPFSVAVLIHLLAIGILMTLSEQQPDEPEYMEMELAELATPTDFSDLPAGAAEPDSAASAAPVIAQSPVIKPSADEFYVNQPVASNAVVQSPAAEKGAEGTMAGSAMAGGAGHGNSVAAGTGAGDGMAAGLGAGTGNGGGVTRGPSIIAREEPDYPDIARQNGWEGTVRLRVLVSNQGTVKNVQVDASSGYVQLDDSARTCVWDSYRFSPALTAGQPVTKWVTFAVRFRLER